MSSPDRFLERILRRDVTIGVDPDKAFTDIEGKGLYGGVPFLDDRAVFPEIRALDSFEGFYKANQYLVELDFYFFAAQPLWLAAKTLIQEEWNLDMENVTLFAHDWLGVPLFWAMKLDDTFKQARTVYFAHETRICRLIVEGVIKGGQEKKAIEKQCSPDGHDASFYAYLQELEKPQREKDDLEQAFPGCKRFDGIFYHVLNRQAEHFDRIVAVGKNVRRETELILRGLRKSPPISLCPNGIPDFTAPLESVAEAKKRLVAFCNYHFGYEPTYIFTSVNRCELSKAPWRNVEFYRAFVEQHKNDDCPSLFIWLARPRPLPTAEEVRRWQDWGWPKEHRSKQKGGDLRGEEEALWGRIQDVNRQFPKKHQILYVNQFGWSGEKLGALDPKDTEFRDLRVGTDVELGLSVYEPFGIAPLEPFSSGAVCVLSDACGCACHLSELQGKNLKSDEGKNLKFDECFVIGRFTQHSAPPERVNLDLLRTIEAQCYGDMIKELDQKLRVDRKARWAAAQGAMKFLSWEAVVEHYLLPELRPLA
ncbi:MAG: hypothetical protein HY268_12415 [Deltaproteobacteria bacterium]|nr:hypothetical protein [Deltaproteobacteria bacterium]